MKKFISILFISLFLFSNSYNMSPLQEAIEALGIKKFLLNQDKDVFVDSIKIYLTAKFLLKFGDEYFKKASNNKLYFLVKIFENIKLQTDVLDRIDKIFEEGTIFAYLSKKEVLNIFNNIQEVGKKFNETDDNDLELGEKIKNFFKEFHDLIEKNCINEVTFDYFDYLNGTETTNKAMEEFISLIEKLGFPVSKAIDLSEESDCYSEYSDSGSSSTSNEIFKNKLRRDVPYFTDNEN
ncbi:hypothetical protein KJ644_02270 [Candidatus Dependentiae bacterium]|nr:hypothetical protein [Candidatus Dependentiae bacterium]MBU4387279.1 hypothetical protein [Candidatus Dependentiae bacterium]MCG2756654.1 hypothetical protein [Candidatus Dependentiae bacterium]